MTLDTKESGVKRVKAKTQQAILPQLFDAALRLLLLLSQVNSASNQDVEAFAPDFSDAFWQMPIMPEEVRFFCATAILQG